MDKRHNIAKMKHSLFLSAFALTTTQVSQHMSALTMSVSETGPKLVTKMLVFTSVTLSGSERNASTTRCV